MTYFPFDQQTCLLKFGSWTFNGDQVGCHTRQPKKTKSKLQLKTPPSPQVSLDFHENKKYVDLSDYWKSGTWDIVEVPGYRNVIHGSPTQMDITFYITIRRKTLFYTVNLILPTVLISFLCVLVFYLPAEAGEKVPPTKKSRRPMAAAPARPTCKTPSQPRRVSSAGRKDDQLTSSVARLFTAENPHVIVCDQSQLQKPLASFCFFSRPEMDEEVLETSHPEDASSIEVASSHPLRIIHLENGLLFCFLSSCVVPLSEPTTWNEWVS